MARHGGKIQIVASPYLSEEDIDAIKKGYADRDEIIDIDKCVEVTNIINPILDREDPIKESYTLDVSTKEKGR